MKTRLSMLFVMITLIFISTEGIATPLRYDFSGAGGASLIGLGEATYTVNNSSLNVRTGSLDIDGNFAIGGGSIELLDGTSVNTSTTLDIWDARSDLPAGLGVSTVDVSTGSGVAGIGGGQVGPGEGLLFEFNSEFTPTSITLSYFFGDGSPFSEDVRLFGDGVFLVDLFSAGGVGVVDIDISAFGEFSSLSLTTRNCEFDCTGRPHITDNSDFVVAYIDGVFMPIPEPSTLIMLALGIIALAIAKSKRY